MYSSFEIKPRNQALCALLQRRVPYYKCANFQRVVNLSFHDVSLTKIKPCSTNLEMKQLYKTIPNLPK